LQLVDLAKQNADRCVVSIFVNPTQFGPNEDLEHYPRTEEHDCELLASRGADLVFLPSVDMVYGDSVSSDIHVPDELNNRLCGKDRPGHFDGVATVVARLFDTVKPEVAIFGQKDYQQVQVIRWLVNELKLKIKIIAAPTVREADGLAMSSRNRYLSVEEHKQATALHTNLKKIAINVKKGTKNCEKLLKNAKNDLKLNRIDLEYIEIRDASSLREITCITNSPARAFIAATIGRARLIDNISLHCS